MGRPAKGQMRWHKYGLCKTCTAAPGEKCKNLRYLTADRLVFANVPHPGRIQDKR